MNVKLSVDGQDGKLIAKSTGLRDHWTGGNRQLQLYDQSVEYNRNGRPGTDAPRSIPGSAAGHLSVQIVESPVIKGGIRAIVLASQSSHELPSSVDVPVGRDLLLTAIGGNGENGMNGEDGVDGRDGVNGVDASETSEATPGSNGGHGGNAGHGGNGGDGGDGGTIEIVLHEDQAHLLIPVKWDLSGGKGGRPGKHGQPGRGGRGGKGGKGYEWTERDGYIYSCTSRCLGGDTTTNSSSLVRYKSVVDMRRDLVLAQVGAQVVTSSNTAQLVARAATRLQELRNPWVSPGACKCHGGQGHCTGCDSRPLLQTHKQVEGLDGLNGHSGTPGTSVLHNGVDGLQGKVTIVVQKSDGSRQEYSSLYSLKLTDFDVEDENRDGIFEPGEHLFVRRITVQNSGGMPSPTRSIQLSMVESDWFKLVDGHDSRTFLPSIREGSSVTIDGPIKVRIREREQHEIPETGALFIRHEAIRLNATVPQIEREISDFKFNRVIEIKYPCELRNFQALATVAHGSQSKLSFEVYNHGSVSIGPRGYNSRVVEIDVSFPAAFGELELEPDQWRESVTITSGDIQGGRGLVLERQFRIHNNAQSYQHIAALFKLYLSKPKQSTPDGQDEVNLVHVIEIRMQVSDHYTINPGASFLLVTNSETGGERARSIRRFINNSLGMEIDTWNISLYAGLDQRDRDSGTVTNVLSRYHGKTVIFLGNQFGFFGQGRKNIFDVCDPEAIAAAAANDTNFLFLDTLDFEPHEKLINEISFWHSQLISGTRANVSQSHQFHSVPDVVAAITQQKQYCDLSHERYAITMSKKWHHVASLRPEILARRVARHLRRKLPTERFLITFNASNPLDIIVIIGIPHHNSMAALERRASSEQRADTSASDGLPLVEAYMIVEAIALHHRVDLLWDTVAGSVSNGNVVALRSQFAIEALTTSLIQTTHREVELLLHKAPWPDKLLPSNPSKHSFEELKALFASHLPTLHAILFHPQASEPAVIVNDNVQSVLSYALAATRPQSKRQIAARVLTSTHNRRRRTNAFLRAGITMFLRKKSFTEIQLSDFFSRASQVHTLGNPTKRNTRAAILQMVAGLTKQSEHVVAKGKQDATDLVRGSSYLAPADWDSRAATAKERSKKIMEEANEARNMLERMLVS